MKTILLIIFLTLLISSCGYIPTNSPLVIKGVKNPEQYIDSLEFQLLNWNIHKEGNKKKWISDIFNSECLSDPDIYLFQEAHLNTGLQYFLSAKKLDWRFVPNAITENMYTGVLSASKVTATISDPIISRGREPITDTPKATLITEYNVQTTRTIHPLLVANIHGVNFVSQDKFNNQIDTLYNRLVPHIGKKSIIVAGDFNSWSSERIMHLNKKLSMLKLEEINLTNATTPDWYVWFFTPIERLPLDRIYFSPEKLTVKSSKVLECTNSSDHKPILVTFEFRENN